MTGSTAALVCDSGGGGAEGGGIATKTRRAGAVERRPTPKLTKCAAKTVTRLPLPLPPPWSARDQPLPLPETVVSEQVLKRRVGGGGGWGWGWRVAGVSVAMLLVIALRCVECFSFKKYNGLSIGGGWRGVVVPCLLEGLGWSWVWV